MKEQKPDHFRTAQTETEPYPGSLARRLFRISLPLIFNQGSVILMLFIDRMFLSWYGTNEISAVWPATFLFISCMTMFYGISSFINIFVAQYFGAGNKKMCSAVIWQGIYLAAGSYLALLCLIPLGREVFSLFGHRAEIASLERTYYTVLMAASVMPLLNNVFASFFTGRGLTYVTMSANVVGNAVNIFLDWVLIFGHFGFPRLGILGAAIATAIASTVPPAIMLVIFLRKSYQAEYETRAQRSFRPKLIKKIIAFGVPSGSQDLTYYIAVALFFMFLGRTLPESLAANNIAWSVNELLTMYIHGLSLATLTILAQAVGAGKPEEGVRVSYMVLKILLFMAALIALVYLLFPETIFSVFRPRVEGAENIPFDLITAKGKNILLFLIGYNFCYAFVYCFRQALRGAGDTKYFFKVALFLDILFFIPGIFLVAKFVETSYIALWCFFLTYLALAGGAHFIRFRKGHWKHIDRGDLLEQA